MPSSICATASIPSCCACPCRAAAAGNERVVTPPPYHHVLAARIGCRREQVTREFTTMSQEALIERTRGALVLKRPDVFERRIAEAMREETG